jgi:hypothetical protein
VWAIADRAVVIGPFDRAQISAFVALPLLLISPGAATIGLAGTSRRAKAELVLALATGVAIVVTLALDVSSTQIGCSPVRSTLEPLLRSTITGVVAGIGYGASVGAAFALETRHHRALAFGAGAVTLGLTFLVTVLVFIWAFPLVACAP